MKVGLVEIGESFGGEYYFPYSLGVLKAYARKHLRSDEACDFGRLIYKRDGLEKNIEHLEEMDMVFFSMYLWNSRITLDIAKKLKERKKGIVTVFGGPQVPEAPDRMKAFLEKHRFIDLASFGEGEVPFLRILESYRSKDWKNVPRVGYRQDDETIVINNGGSEVADINDIPSPYLDGVFDELISPNPDERWLGRFETNRGCPFTCAFCYWGKKAERKVRLFPLDKVFGEIDWFSSRRVEFVFCCDANFGLLKRDLDIARKVAENKGKLGFPKAFSVQNTKNSKETIFELQRILDENGLQKGVNLALQSTNAETLRFIERSNIDNKTYNELQKAFTSEGIPTFTDLIVALPGETYDTFADGVSEIIENGQHNRIQFINLTILENTSMSKPEYQREHGMKIVESRYLSHHSSLDGSNNIVETQSLVVGTKSMPESDWVRARTFAWLTSLLHFDKLLQIPFVIIHHLCRFSYRDLVEAFMQPKEGEPILAGLLNDFREKAYDIQRGGSEYCASEEWLNIMWYPDELAFIRLSAEGRIEQFYDEALRRFCAVAGAGLPAALVSQAVALNKSLLKQPFIDEDAVLECDYDLWSLYRGAVTGGSVELRKGSFVYVVDRTSKRWDNWAEWCRDVIWYGNKKGNYIYSVTTTELDGGSTA